MDWWRCRFFTWQWRFCNEDSWSIDLPFEGIRKSMKKTQVSIRALCATAFNSVELEILHMIAYEYDRREIALESNLSLKEINRIIVQLCEKLDVSSEPGLVRAAFELELLNVR